MNSSTRNDERYVFEFDKRYRPAVAGRPYVARFSTHDGHLLEQRVDIPLTGAGQQSVRVKGTYEVRNGEVLATVETGYAEIFLVHDGFRLPLWWGVPEDLYAQKFWLATLLEDGSALPAPCVEFLNRHVRSLRERGPVRPEEIEAVSRLFKSKRQVNS